MGQMRFMGGPSLDSGVEPLKPDPDVWRGVPRQRSRGVGRFSIRQEGRSRLESLLQEGSAKVRFSNPTDTACDAVLINTGGGLTGGDQFAWRIDLGDDSRCTVVTQACEKIYRADGDDATVSVDLRVGRRARLDWLPQETILFDGARLERTFDIQLAKAARCLAVEAVLLGRRAMGEHTPFVYLRDRWRVWKDEVLIFADEVRLDQTLGAGAALLNGAGAYASVLYVGDDHGERAARVRDLMNAGRDHVHGGASAFEGKLFCRMLARDGLGLRRVLVPVLEALRDGDALPRLWTI